MQNDLNMTMLGATFKLEQPQKSGMSIVGTGWLVRVTGEGQEAKIALVTAFHVFDQMKEQNVKVHWRRVDENGKWHREPTEIRIRDENGAQLWLTHPERDIATLWVNPPEQCRENSIPFEALADEKSLKAFEVSIGDELLALGYPRGLSANDIGFAILRSGRVASYPIWPVKDFPTFLMDFSVFTGNSGGPVYMSERLRKRASQSKVDEAHFVAGILTQQVNLNNERLEIGIVVHSAFVRDLLTELLEDDGEWDMV